MWGVVKRVLPKSALDKVAFLNHEKDVVQVFDLDRLPKGKSGRFAKGLGLHADEGSASRTRSDDFREFRKSDLKKVLSPTSSW